VGEEFGSSEVVGGERAGGWGGVDFAKLDGAGGCVDGAVEEECGFRLGEVFGEVGGPLMAGDYADRGVCAIVVFGPGGEVRTDAVVGA
jgi:hypothetical protein